MTKNDLYTSQLNKIVFNSADVLPNEVTNYLKKFAVSNLYKVKQKILQEPNFYGLLAETLPKYFVDCILDLLIKNPVPKRTNIPSDIPELSAEQIENFKALGMTEDEIPLFFMEIVEPDDNDILENLRIEDYMVFSPPAPIQGPFLYLLNKHEDEGLRLVQTLTNSAVKIWCRNQQKQSLTPLPVTINLLSGERQFWGDAEVYCWYRGSVNAPYPVISSLMALEVWMEKQIEAGRNVEELFEKVLLESECVAVLGICVSMTLAYPDKCLKAALSLISSPAVWIMDIHRFSLDTTNSRQALAALNFNNKWLYEILDKRNKKPQRSLDIRNLGSSYFFFSNDSLRISFEEAVAKFTENLPFQYREEQEDSATVAALQEKMENYQIWGNRENYRYRRVNQEQLKIWVEPPEDIRKRHEEELAPSSEWKQWLRLDIWSQNTIKESKVADRMTIEEAVTLAQELQQHHNFANYNANIDFDNTDLLNNTRLQAIAGVAAAILIADFEWTQQQELVIWSCNILSDAACLSYQADSYRRFSSDPKVSAGRGLGVLVTNSVADIEIRQQILRLITDSQRQVVEAVFRGLFEAWTIDEVLCWNALSLGLSLCLFPNNLNRFNWTDEDKSVEIAEWKKQLLNRHLKNLDTHTIPEISHIPETEHEVIFDSYLAICVLHALPFSKFLQNPMNKERILQLTNDLMAWTVQKNTPVEDSSHFHHSSKPYEWNRFFIRGVSQLAQNLSFDEIQHYILTPIQKTWSKAPKLTADLLDGYISFQIGYLEPLTEEAQLGWTEICNWVLDSPELAKYTNYSWLSNEMEDVVQLILFSRYYTSCLIDEWPHAHLFSNIINKWVRVIGHNPDAYGHLLTMLNGLGRQFVPELALEWLSQCVNPNTSNFWQERRNGERTTELLQKMWNNFEKQIRSNNVILKKYSELVYQLVDAGIPLAGVLRQKLEQR